MKIPVVLSTVHIDIAEDGRLAIDVDGAARDLDRPLSRVDLKSVLDEITRELGAPVRVEIREADGTSYADIATPPDSDDRDAALVSPAPPPGVRGRGFQPGEQVAVACVLCTQTADDDGQAAVRLPPALLAKNGLRMVLIGMTSAAVAEIEQPA